jgi:hypothetical protein
MHSSLRTAALTALQEQLDDLTHEFLAEADVLHQCGEREELQRLAGSFMQHCYERFEEVAGSLGMPPAEPHDPESEVELALPGAEF